MGKGRSRALDALKEAPRKSPGKEYAPVVPTSMDATKCARHVSTLLWWKKPQTLAGLEPSPGRGWYSLPRKFASDLMNQPLNVLCELGGWKTAQTVLQCYQRADEGRLRKALEDRQRALS